MTTFSIPVQDPRVHLRSFLFCIGRSLLSPEAGTCLPLSCCLVCSISQNGDHLLPPQTPALLGYLFTRAQACWAAILPQPRAFLVWALLATTLPLILTQISSIVPQTFFQFFNSRNAGFIQDTIQIHVLKWLFCLFHQKVLSKDTHTQILNITLLRYNSYIVQFTHMKCKIQ